ncbi:LptM family lipoprotein [Streptococcus suis]
MKKIIGLLAMLLSVLVLVACGQNRLNGKYYSVYKGEAILKLEIEGESGKLHDGGTYPVTAVDQEKKQFVVSGFRDVTMMYELSDDGQLTVLSPGWSSTNEDIYYKENSQALKRAIEETQK